MLRIEQLVNDNELNPKYSIINPQNFLGKQENPVIEFHWYERPQKNLKPEIKSIASNLSNIGLIKDIYMYNGKLKQKIEETNQRLDDLKFWSYHAFWKKSGWKSDKNLNGTVLDALSLIPLAVTLPISNQSITGLVGFGLFQITNEYLRRTDKKDKKEKLQGFEEIQDKYNIFIENVNNAKIEVCSSQDAIRFIERIKIKSKENPNYFLLNIDNINKKLKDIYNNSSK